VRRLLGISTFDAAIDRLTGLYQDGHRIVNSFSAGKDSGICLELSIVAATIADRLPVEVFMRDDEIMFPGTFEYAERVAARPEVDFHWIVAASPQVNMFNREHPYWWPFDDQLPESAWVRKYPDFATVIPELNMDIVVHAERFPPADGKELFQVLGLRTQESPNRTRGLHSSGGWLTKKNPNTGARSARPIYDWTDGDVWKAILDNRWDYNSAYDVMNRGGINRKLLRIAPPTMSVASIPALRVAQKSWPQWFDKVNERCPGIRTVTMFGPASVRPRRKAGETWKECYQRLCIDEAPPWIAERAERAVEAVVKRHYSHAAQTFPEAKLCPRCGVLGSWFEMTKSFYAGDPFDMKGAGLGYVEPEFFREGAGRFRERMIV